MWIERAILASSREDRQSWIQVFVGPRQCGKSSLLSRIGSGRYSHVTLDDLQMRTLAERDPALFLEQNPLPLIIDEVQYSPNLLPELKRIVDIHKLRILETGSAQDSFHFRPIALVTGSNRILLDKAVRESLVGRARYFLLNTLSVGEIHKAIPSMPLSRIVFNGGWPEIYASDGISTVVYLNDYIRTYIEKDIVQSAGIEKHREFLLVLRLLAARTGQLMELSSIANQSGVRANTVRDWIGVLEKMGVVSILEPHSDNLNKRLTKTPKVYFLDTGLAVRLQGWSESEPVMNSPQGGHLFETLVLAELVKFINNFSKPWSLRFWRTKEKEEIDFVLQVSPGRAIILDAKLGIQSVSPIEVPATFKKSFPDTTEILIVSAGGERRMLSKTCQQVPLTKLVEVLLEIE